MNYRHGYHAGNFADVHKHVALLALIAALQRKDKGFLYIDTHGGRGWYDLRSSEATHSGEARSGVRRLAMVTARSAALRRYQDALASLAGQSPYGESGYPGSPVLAAAALRAQDRAVCHELKPSECRALQRSLQPFARSRAECGDGWQSLRALLPARERRALVLIDPPYEDGPGELAAARAGLHEALARQANALLALWYPIKHETAIEPWLAGLAGSLAAPTVCAELWLHARDAPIGLNGSGLLLVNPPWQIEDELAAGQAELLALLAEPGQGGSALRWLVARPAGPRGESHRAG